MTSARDHSRHPDKRLILVIGGARSGKSAYAEELARRMVSSYEEASTEEDVVKSPRDPAAGPPLIYLATAPATGTDEEMRERIASHRRARGNEWLTIEEPSDPAGALNAGGTLERPGTVVLLDCLTLLVSNLLLAGTGMEAAGQESEGTPGEQNGWRQREPQVAIAIDELLSAYRRGEASLICVSNEVGMGLVPAYPLGRVYRDVLGRVNARIAGEADAVLFMLAGLPVEIKSLSEAWNAAAARRLGR